MYENVTLKNFFLVCFVLLLGARYCVAMDMDIDMYRNDIIQIINTKEYKSIISKINTIKDTLQPDQFINCFFDRQEKDNDAIKFAVQTNNPDIVKYIINTIKETIFSETNPEIQFNLKNKFIARICMYAGTNENTIMRVIINGNIDILKCIIDTIKDFISNETDPNKQYELKRQFSIMFFEDPSDKYTLLMCAVKNNNFTMVKYITNTIKEIISNQTDPKKQYTLEKRFGMLFFNHNQNNKYTLLMYAVETNNFELICYVIDTIKEIISSETILETQDMLKRKFITNTCLRVVINNDLGANTLIQAIVHKSFNIFEYIINTIKEFIANETNLKKQDILKQRFSNLVLEDKYTLLIYAAKTNDLVIVKYIINMIKELMANSTYSEQQYDFKQQFYNKFFEDQYTLIIYALQNSNFAIVQNYTGPYKLDSCI